MPALGSRRAEPHRQSTRLTSAATFIAPTTSLEQVAKNMKTMDKAVEEHRAARRKARREAKLAKKHFQFPVYILSGRSCWWFQISILQKKSQHWLDNNE